MAVLIMLSNLANWLTYMQKNCMLSSTKAVLVNTNHYLKKRKKAHKGDWDLIQDINGDLSAIDRRLMHLPNCSLRFLCLKISIY